MDLESEGSVALESVEENVVTLEKLHCDDEKNCRFGSHGDSVDEASTPAPIGNIVKLIGEEVTHMRSNVVHTDDSSPASKGFGLKKWRRIRRDIVKDPSASVESKILKRGLSDTGKLTKSKPLAHDIRHTREDPVVSSIRDKNVGLIDASTNRGYGSDSRTDSGNSEDRSSKSSSVTSTPKFRYDMPPGSGLAQEERRVKSMSSRNLASSTQRLQQGKGRTEIRKKPDGEQIKMEKENSHSNTSLSGSNFEASYGETHDRRSFNHDQNNMEVQASYCNENEDHLTKNFAANLSSDIKEEKVGNFSTLEDPLIDSLCILQSVQKALEEEIQKYDSMKTSSAIIDMTALDPRLHESYISDQSVAGGTEPTYSSPLELLVLTLTQDVNVLENKLSDLQGILALKDGRINELETSLKISHELPEVESGSAVRLSAEEFRVASELESFFRQKIETEIECLVITRMTQNFKVVETVQRNVLEELETSSERQELVLNKLGIAESKAAVLKNKADKLGNYCGDILGIEETFMIQKRLCKVTLCFFVQFMLLIMGFLFFILQLLPSSVVVIPT